MSKFDQKRSTGIAWTEHTHNFWYGCEKVSLGCKNCYMYRMLDDGISDISEVKLVMSKKFFKPVDIQEPLLIFTCSFSDFFIDQADGWRNLAWAVIKACPQHTWQILTKRPERILECLPDDWGEGYPNVWLGVSVESQKYIHRMNTLSKIPAAVRFVSVEPILEEIDLFVKSVDGKRIIDDIDWVIVGGESGLDTGKYGYRPSEISWYEKIVKDLRAETDVAIFIKQMGTHLAKHGIGSILLPNGQPKDMHGTDMSQFPANLRIQEMPK